MDSLNHVLQNRYGNTKTAKKRKKKRVPYDLGSEQMDKHVEHSGDNYYKRRIRLEALAS